ADEEDARGQAERRLGQTKIIAHRQLGEPDVGPVQVVDEVEQAEEREQPQGHPADGAPLQFRGRSLGRRHRSSSPDATLLERSCTEPGGQRYPRAVAKPAVISAILFDADGVVQQARPDWRTRLGSCVAPEAAETFVDEVLDAELSVLSGGDFTPALQRVLDRWQVDRPVQEVLRIWELIMVDQKMITAIQQLRDGGILCYLATNQQEFRRRVMRTRLPYDQAFDDQFYSC